MSESSLSSKKEKHAKFERDIFLSSAAVFLFPLLLFIPKEGSPGIFYFAATGSEFFLSLIFLVLQHYEKISRRNYRILEYYLRFITGLPMTVYLFSFPFSSLPVLIRFFFAYLILFRMGMKRTGRVFLFLFAAGTVVFAYFFDSPFPVRRQVFLVLSAFLMTAVMESYSHAFQGALKIALRRRLKK